MSIQDSITKVWEEYIDATGLPSCAFSTQTNIRIGTGTTTQNTISKVMWFAEQVSENSFEVQELNSKDMPVGKPAIIPRDEFLARFHPELAYFRERVQPAIGQFAKHLTRGDSHRKRNETYSAQLEYEKALSLNDQSVRALFGLGLVYLARTETEKAAGILEELVSIEATFSPEHKHLFNDFGIQMRKNGMHETAIRYYRRALTFSREDENLFFNLARAHFEKNDLEQCVENLHFSIDINNRLPETATFVNHLLQLARKGAFQFQYGAASMRLKADIERLAKRLSREEPNRRTVPAKSIYYVDGDVDVRN